MKVIKFVISTAICLLLVNGHILAQEQAKKILIEQDVINFAKNYNKISEELEKMNFNFGNENFTSIDDISKAYKNSDLDAVNKVLNKYGISNPDPAKKVMIIGYALIIETFNREIVNNPEIAVYMQMYGGNGDPTAEIRKNVHPADLALVQKHYSKYEALLKE